MVMNRKFIVLNGRAEKRQQILNDVRAGRARPFYGDGRTLGFYIEEVGLNQVVVTLDLSLIHI